MVCLVSLRCIGSKRLPLQVANLLKPEATFVLRCDPTRMNTILFTDLECARESISAMIDMKEAYKGFKGFPSLRSLAQNRDVHTTLSYKT